MFELLPLANWFRLSIYLRTSERAFQVQEDWLARWLDFKDGCCKGLVSADYSPHAIRGSSGLTRSEMVWFERTRGLIVNRLTGEQSRRASNQWRGRELSLKSSVPAPVPVTARGVCSSSQLLSGTETDSLVIRFQKLETGRIDGWFVCLFSNSIHSNRFSCCWCCLLETNRKK